MDGRAHGRADGRADGRTDGRADGRTDGVADGRVDGRTDGRAASQASLLSRNNVFHQIPLPQSRRTCDVFWCLEDASQSHRLQPRGSFKLPEVLGGKSYRGKAEMKRAERRRGMPLLFAENVNALWTQFTRSKSIRNWWHASTANTYGLLHNLPPYFTCATMVVAFVYWIYPRWASSGFRKAFEYYLSKCIATPNCHMRCLHGPFHRWIGKHFLIL